VLAVVCSMLPLGAVIDALITTRILVQFMGQVAAVVVLRRTQPEMERPFKMWLYPLPAIVALVGWIFLFSTSGVAVVLFGVATLALGVVVFLGWAWRTSHWPFAETRNAEGGTRN